MVEKENPQPLISVIIPVHNGGAYISGCVESVLAQSWKNLEIIIINDGSVDDTGEVCKNLAEKSKETHIQVLTLNDKGVSCARNTGLDQAKGEYVTFVDADDRLCPDMVERLYRILLENRCAVSGCRFLPFHSWKEWGEIAQKEQAGENKEVRVLSGREFVKEGILEGDTRCWSKLYLRSAVKKVRFREDLRIGEDMFFLLELALKDTSFACAEFKGYGYYQNLNGAMNRPFTPVYMDQITCWELAQNALAGCEERICHKVISIVMTSCILTMSKIALLSLRDRKQYKNCMERCRDGVRKHFGNKNARKLMPSGYSFKARLLIASPKAYAALYHLRKYR